MSDDPRFRAPQRIEKLILAIGSLGAIVALAIFSWRDSVGTLVGSALTWLNFHWMRTSVVGLTNKLAQRQDASGSTLTLALKFILRYAVVIAVAYATLNSSVASVFGVFAGLLVIVPALMLEAVYEFYLGRQPGNQVSNPGPTE